MQERNTLLQLFQNCILFGNLVQALLCTKLFWRLPGLTKPEAVTWFLNAAQLFNKLCPWPREEEASPTQRNVK